MMQEIGGVWRECKDLNSYVLIFVTFLSFIKNISHQTSQVLCDDHDERRVIFNGNNQNERERESMGK